VSACGFTPVYKQDSMLATELAAIEVAPIRLKDPKQARAGQLLRQALRETLNPSHQATIAKYLLELELETTSNPIIVVRTKEIGRYNTNLKGNYRLNQNNTSLSTGTSHVISSYNAAISDYATYASKQDSIHRGVEEMAEDVRMRLIRYFQKK